MNTPLVYVARILAICFLALSCTVPGFAGAGAFGSQTAATAPAPSSGVAPKAATGTPSAADIASAKASHKVWANLNTGLYHKGGRWYGKTKGGKFMTVDEARKAGYKPAKRD
jgi:hypothetical protein